MSSNNVTTGYQFWTSQSLSGNLTSQALNTNHQDNIGLQLNISGSASGSFFVQVSADHQQDDNGNVQVAGNWIALTPTPPPVVVSGSPTIIYIDLNQLSSPWIRVIYTSTSGTGTVNGFFVAKSL